VVAAIGRARAELRDLSALLGSPVVTPVATSLAKPPRRKSKVTTLPVSGSLFPC
jgi:hypothetical protein